jgi:hypothetical protein
VGTSSVVYPAAMFAPQVAEAGKPVVEINLEPTDNTHVRPTIKCPTVPILLFFLPFNTLDCLFSPFPG